jgi:hypothetical protein
MGLKNYEARSALSSRGINFALVGARYGAGEFDRL